MDPVTLIVTALAKGSASGAIEGMASGAKEAVKAAYAKLRDLVQQRFRGDKNAEVVLAEHQADPATYEVPLEKKLAAAGAADDAELLAAARALLELVDRTGMQSGKYNLTIKNAKGFQVGDGNTQINM